MTLFALAAMLLGVSAPAQTSTNGAKPENLVAIGGSDSVGGADDAALAVTSHADRVFIASSASSPAGGRWFIEARAAATGAEIWTVEIALGPGDEDDAPEDLVVTQDGTTLVVSGPLADAVSLVPEVTVIALDTVDGSVRWTESFGRNAPSNSGKRSTSLALAPDDSTVAVTGTVRPFSADSDALVAALDVATGAVLWEDCIDTDNLDRSADVAFDPSGLAIYVLARVAGAPPSPSSDGTYRTVAYGAATGAELWSHDFEPTIEADDDPLALATNGQQVVAVGSRREGSVFLDGTVALDAATGQQLWTTSGPASANARSSLLIAPLGTDQFILVEVPDTALPFATEARISRIDGATGARSWSTDYLIGGMVSKAAQPLGLQVSSDDASIALVGRQTPSLLVGSIEYSSFASVYDAATGNREWLEIKSDSDDDGFFDVALAGGNLVAVGTTGAGPQGTDRRAVGYAVTDGGELFEVTEDGPQAGSAFGLASVLEPLSGDLFVAGRDVSPDAALLSRIDGASGDVLWNYSDSAGSGGGGHFETAVVDPVGGVVFAGGTDGADVLVCAFDAATGSLLWRATFDGPDGLQDTARALRLSHDGASLFIGARLEEPLPGPSSTEASSAMGVVALNSADGSAIWTRFWNPTFGEELVDSFALSADGTRIAAVGKRQPNLFKSFGEIVVFTTSNGAFEWITTLEGGDDPADPQSTVAAQAAFSPDGSELWVVGSETNPTGTRPAVLWTLDASNGNAAKTATIALPNIPFRAVDGRFAADLSAVVTIGMQSSQGDGLAAAFDLSTGQGLWIDEYPLPGITGIRTVAVGTETATAILGGRFEAENFWARAVDLFTGEPLWTAEYEPIPTFFTGSGLNGVEALTYDYARRRVWLVGSGANVGTTTKSLALSFTDPALVAPSLSHSYPFGGTTPHQLRAGSPHADDLYLLLGTASGPGSDLVIDGQVLPIVFDSYTTFTLSSPNSALLPTSLGTLDAYGRASAPFVLPPVPVQPTATFSLLHTYVALDPATLAVVQVSNTIPVTVNI